jgi:hypothetical protein
MIDLLADALQAVPNSDWAVTETVDNSLQQQIVHAPSQAKWQTGLHTSNACHYDITLYCDVAAGRGSARLRCSRAGLDIATIVAALAKRCENNATTPWKSKGPSAPANVEVMDPQLADATAYQQFQQQWTSAATAQHRAGDLWTLQRVVSNTTVRASGGFQHRWPSSFVRMQAQTIVDSQPVHFVQQARSLQQLSIAGLTHRIAKAGSHASAATALPAGTWPVVLEANAMLFDGALGVWRSIVVNGDARRQRDGLAQGTTAQRSSLSIMSNGARQLGLFSAPLAMDGSAVRRFTIVENGRFLHFGNELEIAGLTGKPANGGIRNLEVALGASNVTLSYPHLSISEIADTSFNDNTGQMTARIVVATLKSTASPSSWQPVKGSVLSMLVLPSLLNCQRSMTLLQNGAYSGPDSVLFDAVTLL